MHRFQPRIYLVVRPDGSNAPITDIEREKYRTYIFPETIFTAVTAYQNQLVSYFWNLYFTTFITYQLNVIITTFRKILFRCTLKFSTIFFIRPCKPFSNCKSWTTSWYKTIDPSSMECYIVDDLLCVNGQNEGKNI